MGRVENTPRAAEAPSTLAKAGNRNDLASVSAAEFLAILSRNGGDDERRTDEDC